MEMIKIAQEASNAFLVIPTLSKSTKNILMLIAISYSGLLICVGFVVLMAWMSDIPLVL